MPCLEGECKEHGRRKKQSTVTLLRAGKREDGGEMQGGLAQLLLRTSAPGFYICITWAGYNQQEAVFSWHSRRQLGSCVGYLPVYHTSES